MPESLMGVIKKEIYLNLLKNIQVLFDWIHDFYQNLRPVFNIQE